MALNENTLGFLRRELAKYISGKRLTHSYAVEDEAAALGKLFALSEDDLIKLRIAAILHDITKEKSTEDQITLCRKYGVTVTDDDIASPKVFHSVTGAYEARTLYPDIVDETIFNAIKYHTTGRAEMTLFEKLLYLADYIERTRTFSDCIKLREYFYSSPPTTKHLNNTILLSYDMTVSNLLEEAQAIHVSTVLARNSIIKEIRKG